MPLRSRKNLRDEHMVRQAYDYSCGVAALTTLLSNNSVVTAEATQADGGNILEPIPIGQIVYK